MFWCRFLILSACLLVPHLLLSQEGIVVIVEADRYRVGEGQQDLDLLEVERRAGSLDAAALLERKPGLSMVRNGALTGIPQMGGFYGERVGIRVDGMQLTPACPNHMDPPLHYISPHAIEEVTIHRVGPVRAGGDHLGVHIEASRQAALYAAEEEWIYDGMMGTHYIGSHHGIGGFARSRVGNDQWSAGYSGSVDSGGNLQFPGGEVLASEYFSQEHHLFLAHQSDYGEWVLRLGTNRAENVGTPSLPMDMIEDIGYGIGLDYETEWDSGRFEASFYFHDVDHLMDRYTLRPFVPGPPPAGGNPPIETQAMSQDWGGKWAAEWDIDWMAGGILRVGFDTHFSALDAASYNRANRTSQDLFIDSRRDRVGAFVEWEQDWSEEFTSLLGVRGDFVSLETGEIRQTGSAAAAADALAFNTADRDKFYAHGDVMLQVNWDPDHPVRLQWSWARKSRAPGYSELYNYTPAQSTAGLADGRTYIGNLDLDSEVAYVFEWQLEWEEEDWVIRASPYYSYVDGFIQGRPTSRLFAGLPVLQYQNVNAEIYGVVSEAYWQVHEMIALTGNLSYTRGRDVLNHDNLYRISPLRGEMAVEHTWGNWTGVLGLEWFDSQDQTAAYNGELPTGGVTLFNLQGAYAFESGWTVVVGLKNLFDENYENHLNGVNRVPGSDVARGLRLPSPGRYVYGSVVWEF
jgi:iron complex outermembrane receptor protein